MKTSRIAFIGAGNMAQSLIGGLIADGWDPGAICVADPNAEQLEILSGQFPVSVNPSNHAVIENSELVLLAVKPQVMREVARDIAADVHQHQPVVVSIAAGIRIHDLQRWLNGYSSLVRCMPNTPSLVQSGATALIATSEVTEKQKNLSESIMRAVGLAIWLDNESQIDAVTALSGSGPAYFFMVIEALQNAGQSLGLDEHTAKLLAVQTAFGAAKMALESDEDASTLRRRVTSPGGTTEKALAALKQGGLYKLFEDALAAAHRRSQELAEEFGAD